VAVRRTGRLSEKMVDKCEPRTFIVHCVLHVRFFTRLPWGP
jgi:hypothetical protein